MNVATGGFGTEVTVKTDPRMKQQLGGAAYILTGVQQHSYLAAQFSVQCCVSVWSLGNSNKTVYTQASN